MDSRFRGNDGIWPCKLNLHYISTALASAYLLACSLPTYSAEITYFYDGDTVKINDAGYVYKLRINDIDAPERNQAYGKKSRRALMQLCTDTTIFVAISGIDKYQRRLGKLSCDGKNASLYMVKNGHAWFYNRYSADGTLAFAEQEARRNKLGLWKSKQQTPPWVWRKNHPH